MIAAEKGLSIVLACLMLAISVAGVSTARAQEGDCRDVYDYYKNEIRRGPVPGRIIVSVSQSSQQADLFSMQDNRVVIKNTKETSSELSRYKVERSYKAFHVHGTAVYVLTFADYGSEREIMRYLESLPGVQYAEQDYYLELLAEPNDRYYISSTANWWVPDDIESGATPATVPWGCPANPPYAYWAIRDTSEMDDQWYLKHVQANKAWDIEQGDAAVKVMVMDSGIDIWHQDLYANIWKNPADLQGDMSGDGLPGDKAQGDMDNDGSMHFNDPDVRTKDFNKNGAALFGPDSTCDAGPDGDYGFGLNAIDDPPAGPGGGDDDTLMAGQGNDPWDDNLRGPGCLNPQFDDDMWDVQFLKNDDDENGYPDDHYGFNFLQPDSLPVDQGCPVAEACHGTGMAGIIGAVTNNGEGIAGLLWNCRLVSAKIALGFPENGGDANIPRIAEALYYAADNGIDVVNMSLGYIDTSSVANYNSPTIQQAVDYAYNHGVVVIAGAGNLSTGHYWYPASLDHVISVSGTNRLDKKASYTEYNDRVDACAPVAEKRTGVNPERGDEVVATGYALWPYPMYNLPGAQLPHDYVITKLQTSGATAQVSGLAGLLVSLYPKSLMQEIMGAQYTPTKYVDFIETQTKRGCVAISDTFYTKQKLGAGRINAYRSMTQWGRIRNDTTWTKFAYVSADLKIDAGKTLTIEPGTVIYLAPDDNGDFGVDSSRVVIEVWGTLNANGTAQNPIVFQSWDENPSPGDWYGIWYKGNSASGSLSHCVIQDAKYGVKSAVTIEMHNCEITNSLIAGIYLYDDMDSTCVVDNESVIEHCTISENDHAGASAMQIWNCPLDITVDSCTVNMNYRGIWVSNARPTISWCEIACNQEDGIWVTSYQYDPPLIPPYPTISRCRIFMNGASGIYCMYNKAQISYTKSWENESYGLLAYGLYAYPEVDHSKIIDNAAAGVRAEVTGTVVLGNVSLGKGQNNSLYGQVKNVYNATAATLYAENCWWGASPPDHTKMYGSVDYTPYLTSDPVPNLAPAKPNKMPPVFALAQNYPNPFGASSETTSIRYSIPSSGTRVVLRVYDVSGRLVRTLVNSVREGDQYTAVWDGRNDRGSRVAAGIYFYKLQNGPKTMTKKMVLFR